MSRFPLALLFLLLLLTCANAQNAFDANAGLRITSLSNAGMFQVTWWGASGRIYFIEHSEDLYAWSALPNYEAGNNAILTYNFILSPPPARFFTRVRWIESSLTAFQFNDYDSDGLVNGEEASLGLNPFARDSDGDGMPDGWEQFFGLNPLIADAGDDADQDGIPNNRDARPTSSGAGYGELTITIINPTS